MENFMEKQICSSKLANTTPQLSMHKNSQTISKSKPKIRIIHIFAPEIIKTDAENFRELVQRLTGKPTPDDQRGKTTKSRKKEKKIFSSTTKKIFRGGFRERSKGEEEIWSGANSGGGFLGGFGDQFECGFMQELVDDDHEFPFVEGTTHEFPFLEGTTQVDVYGETSTIC